MPATFYSERLGPIEDAQLEAAAKRLGLGKLVSAAPTTGGLFGQNLYLTTTEGEFVLRGAPHWYKGKPLEARQFRHEKFFIDRLHENTSAPVPWPALYDETGDIFGWPYMVMPRLAGSSVDINFVSQLPGEEQRSIARALGETLAALQELRGAEAGEVDESLEFAAFPEGYAGFLIEQINIAAQGARNNGTFDDADRTFVDALVEDVLASDVPDPVTYTHGDYSLGNVLLVVDNGGWHVSGVFDFHTSCFGNAVHDLCRQSCLFSTVDRELVQVYVDGWRSRANQPPIDPVMLRLCLCNERIMLWDYFSRPANVAEWTQNTSFRAFLKFYERQLLRTLQYR